jgi:RNA-directed DNA polymerase
VAIILRPGKTPDGAEVALVLRHVIGHIRARWPVVERNRGTPQGGVVSPILANPFMHYAFDAWMARRFPDLPWCRYADDGLVHCRSEKEAQTVREALEARLAECRLELHPPKTKIVYCKDDRRKGKYKYKAVSFDVLGYRFRPRSVKGPHSQMLFCGFTPAVSKSALNAMRATIRDLKFLSRAKVNGRQTRDTPARSYSA